MPTILDVRDESVAGVVEHRLTLEFPSETVTVRELIRARVYQEVQDANRRPAAGAARSTLVTPTEREVELNGVRSRREIDWKKQFEVACEAYEKNRVLILVGDRQTGSLEETITIGRGTEVVFLRLVPLVGG